MIFIPSSMVLVSTGETTAPFEADLVVVSVVVTVLVMLFLPPAIFSVVTVYVEPSVVMIIVP